MGDLLKGLGKTVVRGFDPSKMPEDVAPMAEILKEQILEATKDEPSKPEKDPSVIDVEGITIEEQKL